ncbi:hypothetical protein D3C76_1209370 [compost metagenome]
MVEQLARKVGFLCRVGDVVGQRRAGQEQRTLHRQQYGVECRDRAGGRTHANHQAATLKRVQRAHEGVLADAVEHHVDANAVRQFANALGDIFMAVIDRVVATMGLGNFALGFGGHGADDRQAQQLGPLRNNQAHTTGGGVQQDAVTGLEVVDAAHQVR